MDKYELEIEYIRVCYKLRNKLGGNPYRFISDGYVKEIVDEPTDIIRIRKATTEELALQAKKRELCNELKKYI